MHNKKISPAAAIFAVAVALFSAAKFAQAETTPHIIINEIQASGASSSDEFIELFNPTDSPIVLDGYKLNKKTKSGSESTLLSSTTATKFLGTIPAHGYFLIAHPNYDDALPADLLYASSSGVANDNTVLLYDKNGVLLDKVGFGAASDFENAPASNPTSNQSLERIAFADTDNNAADFFISASPAPENSTVVETDNENDLADDDDTPDDPEKCATFSEDIRLNEIFPYPQSGDEFVEITNAGENCVDVSSWKVMDGADHKKTFPENSMIYPGEYLFLEGNLFLNNDSDTVYLLATDGSAKDDALDHRSYEKAREGFSFAFDGKGWNWTSVFTPEAENIFDSSVIEASTEASMETSKVSNNETKPSEKVYLNEILPNPKGDEEKEEFIELVNNDSGPIDLFGWTIRDGSKTGKYVFKEHVEIESGEYFAIYRPDSKITLNNSSESVTLYNPQGKITSSVSYDKSTEDASYSFDGKKWKWSKYLTPSKKNKFDSEPSMKITKPKSAHKGLFTEFDAKAKDKETKKLKYAWDFGDGKKSYLAKTTHKYLDTGKYTVTLSVTDDSQTVEKSFSLQVKKYPRPDLEIMKIIPNPAGSDAEAETIDLKNNSNKKINLKGWKIATGSGEKLFNHPISGEFSLDANETKTVTREFSKFSLNNKAGKVQLVMPDEKVIDEIKYSKEKIADDEAYTKIDGEWQWIAPGAKDENANPEENAEVIDDPTGAIDNANNGDGEVLGAADENMPVSPSYDPSFSSEDAYIFLSDIGFLKSQTNEINYCPLKSTTTSLEYYLISSI
jgi:hypothetical protein